MVVYALAESGYIGFYDPSATPNRDLYFVARSLRPVAVAYDPVDQVILVVYFRCRSLLIVRAFVWGARYDAASDQMCNSVGRRHSREYGCFVVCKVAA